jgi:hypothetical protein
MPMDGSAGAGFVSELHAESFTRSKANAGTPVGTCQSENFGWSALHLQHARSGDKTLGSRRSPARGIGEDGQYAGSKRSAQKSAAREGLAHDIALSLSARGRLENSSHASPMLKPRVATTSITNAR